MKQYLNRWRAYWHRYGIINGLMIIVLQPLCREVANEILKDEDSLKCILNYDEAIDMTKTVIGINHSSLQTTDGKAFADARDEIAKLIVDNLSSRKVKRIYGKEIE